MNTRMIQETATESFEVSKLSSVSFAGGENKEVAKKFLSRLKRCKISVQISDSDMLAIVSSALVEDACFWFRANKKRFRTWQDFERLFARYYIATLMNMLSTKFIVENREGRKK